MIVMQGSLPKQVTVACSGGVDSMAVVDFLRRKHEVQVAFFNHGTPEDNNAQTLVIKYCDRFGLKLVVGHIINEKPNGKSLEEFWRDERHGFFNANFSQVIACHHLDDCVETWIWSSMHGEGKIIPYQNKAVVRPFRLNRKSEFVDWCKRFYVPWYEDKTNANTERTRNYIRHEMMANVLVVNPGIHKVIAKKVRADFKGE